MAKIDWHRTPIRPTGYDAEGNIQWGIREETYNGKRIQQVTATTARIELTRGQWALVDIEDLPRLKRHSWFALLRNNGFYAGAKISSRLVYMNRFIMSYTGPDEVDHINRDKLDNRKSNLCIADKYKNASNNSSSGIRQQCGKWQARLWHYHKEYCATFDTKEEAFAWRIRKKQELANE
jgi:hypothetical protein